MSIAKTEFLQTMRAILTLQNLISNDKYLDIYKEVTILATDWEIDETENYPAYYDIYIDGITTNHKADIVFMPTDTDKVNLYGISECTETLLNKIRIRAIKIPKENLTAIIYIKLTNEEINEMAIGMTNSGGLTAYNTTLILERITHVLEVLTSGSIAGSGSGTGGTSSGTGGVSGVTNATVDAESSVEFKLGGDNSGVYVATGDDMANALSYGIGMDSLGFYVNVGEE